MFGRYQKYSLHISASLNVSQIFPVVLFAISPEKIGRMPLLSLTQKNR